MAKYLLTGCFVVALPTIACAQTVGGGGSIALPEIIVNSNEKFDPYNGKFNGVIGETSDITGINKPILDIPRSVYVVTPKTLQEQMPQSLAEAVESIPGTYMGNQGGGNTDLITIKGFQVGTVDSFIVGNYNGLLVDGIRAPYDRAFNANTQSIELISGPDSYLYGYTEEGGVLNIQRKLPLPEQHVATDILAGAVTGSFKDIAGSFDITGPIFKSVQGVLAYRLVASASNDAPWREGDPVSRDFLLAPTLAYYSDFVTATVAYEHAQNQQPYDRGTINNGNYGPLNLPVTESYSEPYSTYDEKLDWIHGKVDLNLDKNNQVFFKYSYSSTALNFAEIRSDTTDNSPTSNPPIVNFDPNTGVLNRYFYTNDPGGQENQQFYTQLRGVHNFDTGFIHHEFNEGVDFYDQNEGEADELVANYPGFSQPTLPFPLYAPYYGQGPTTPLTPFITSSRDPEYETLTAKIHEWGYFGQEAATIGPVTFTGGGRYTDLYSYQEYYGYVNDNNTVHKFLPSGSVLLKMTDTASVFADYAQSIHPNIFAQGTGYTQLYGAVVPETGEGEEAGIKAKFLDGKILAQASAFNILKKNVADLAQVSATELLESFGQTAQSKGISLSVLGSLTPNLDINLTYNHQDVRIISDYAINMDMGNVFPNAPANTYSAILAYHFLEGPLNHLTLMGQVHGASSNAVDTYNTFFLPGYTIVDLGASYTINRGPKLPVTTVSLKCNNIADTKYYPATGTKDNWITVGEPRNILVDVNTSF